MSFAHERLDVYQKAIEFVAWTQELIEGLPARASVRDQLDRASTSIPLNIAEGNVKASKRDRARFLQIANGSAVDCAACLDVIVARKLADHSRVIIGKRILRSVCQMLFSLLKRFDSQVVEEEAGVYGAIGLGSIDDDDRR